MGEVSICADCAEFLSDGKPHRRGACIEAPLEYGGKVVAFRAVAPSTETGVMPWCPYKQKEDNDVPRK